MEMPPVFQKSILERESPLTSMPNLASNSLGRRYFSQEMLTNTASNSSTQFTISKQIKKKRYIFLRILTVFSMNIKVPKPQEMHLVLMPSY